MAFVIGGLGNILGSVAKKAVDGAGGTPTPAPNDQHQKAPSPPPTDSCPDAAISIGATAVGGAAVSPAQTGKTIGGAVASLLGGNHTEQAPTEHYPNHFN
jgi:hypothetical protein